MADRFQDLGSFLSLDVNGSALYAYLQGLPVELIALEQVWREAGVALHLSMEVGQIYVLRMNDVKEISAKAVSFGVSLPQRRHRART